jgi:hypothetical protein
MGQATKTSSSKIVSLILVVFALIVCWWLSPIFLPIWRWQNLKFPELAAQLNIDETQLRTQFDIKFRYHPRGSDDPLPWQLLVMSPAWDTIGTDHENEESLAVRCTLMNDHTGTPPSKMWVGNTFKDRYFSAKAWRLPPGTFDCNGKRPVLVYDANTLEKLSFTDANAYETHLSSLGTWDNDDEWESRNDGWVP